MDADLEPAPRRIPIRLIASVFVVFAVLLAGWYFLFLRQDYVTLYSDLRPQQAAPIVQALDERAIPYRLATQGSEILVPAANIDAARVELGAANTLPAGSDGFELFNETDMGMTDFAQKIRYQRALQGELARTIMMMDGVAEARVHISMPERALFRGERRNAEAAVTLVMRSPQEETPARIEGVQRLVAAAVPDLLVSDVVVLNGRGEIISPRVEISDAITRASAGPLPDPNAPSIEFVMDVMRAALPQRRFEVTIEAAPQPLADGEESATGVPERLVTVLTETPLESAEMERVSAALRNADVVDGASRGTLVFRVGPPSMFEALPAPAVAATADTRTEAAPMPFNVPFWMMLALAALAAVAGACAWAWFNRPRLAPEEHARFADTLRTLLRDGAGDARNA